LALTPNQNEAFFREVDEELRRAQLTTFAQRYGKMIVGAILLFLIAVGAFLWWQHRQASAAAAQAEEFISILNEVEAGRTEGLDARLNTLAEDGSAGYRAAALFAKAALAIQADNDAGAIELYKKIVADDDLAQPYRDLALVRQTALEFDKLPPEAVIERLRPLAVKGNPWFGSAGEMVAVAYMKQQKPDLAARLLGEIARDQQVPASIRNRAGPMASGLGLDMGEDVPAAPEAAAAKEGK